MMTISISSSQTTPATDLKAQGLSASKVKLVEADLKKATAQSASSGSKTATPDVRVALNQRMSADVASGKLTQKNADAVNKTLDDMAQADGLASGTAASSGQGSAAATSSGTASQGTAVVGGRGEGGGGGGSASKTELSRSVVVSGALETITITYIDGTTETETKASGADALAKSGSTSTADQEAAASYAKADKLPSGSLVDQVA